ncbi:M1 family metallopeptidase [Geotalea uraniireducens]|uniref:M1 family metallopeptidase n=1 Tax=Geotalea uraniireducens TaxID=351604 RepID=UPI0024914391|nr:M1 family aminopeptidase [Geotalea uraniireducens]
MKPLLLLIVILFASLPLPACSTPSSFGVERQELRVRLDPEHQLLTGETLLQLSGEPAVALSLTLNPAAEIDRVAVAGQPAHFRRTGDLLVVELPERSPAPQVTVSYHCRFADRAPAHPVATEDPTYGVSGTISPQGTYLGSDAEWYPVPPVRPGRRTLTLIAPAGTEAISAGRRIARTTAAGVTSSTWEEEHPVETLALSAGPYRIEERQLGSLPLYTYFLADDAPLADSYLAASARYLAEDDRRFGTYPFEKFAVVENFFPTGYGFPSYTLIGGTVIRLPFIIDTSLPHEIAHNWWGNGVLVDYRRGNWSEGLVTYLADYHQEERQSPRAARGYRFRILADYASLVGPGADFPLRQFVSRSDPASRSIGYGKGAMLFHMIRRRIGNKAFEAALREVFRDKCFQRASWDDFTRAFSRAAGEELTPFVAQWLDRPGGPRLSFAGVTRQRRGVEWEVRGTVRQEGTPYAVPLTIRLTAGGESYDRTLQLASAATPFAFRVPAAPERLLLDPEVDLFRLLAADELPATVNRLKGSRALTVVVATGYEAYEPLLRLLLRSLGREDAVLVREGALSTAALANRDLLLCGIPRAAGLLPVLPAEVKAAPAGFTVDGVRYAAPGDALFVAGNRLRSSERVAALFLPRSLAAAEACALKITHYGRYSLLVFSAGENRRKETVPPVAGAGTVVF